MLGAFLVRSGVLTSVHAFAVDPRRGVLLLLILGAFAGAGFALFAWRAPRMGGGGLFAPVSREGVLVLNNLFLAAATATVLLGTLYPLIRQALTGEAISVGAPYFALTFAPLMAACLLLTPVGPLSAWKRSDLGASLRPLAGAGVVALLAGLLAFWLVAPRRATAAVGVALGVWLILGALTETAQRVRAGRADLRETGRRLRGLPRGAWGVTLAHAGLGVFALGASCETAWRVEAADTLSLGRSLAVAGYTLTLERVGGYDGPNFSAERAVVRVIPPHGAPFTATPERRFYPARNQTVARVALERRGVSDLYVVLGERRTGAGEGWAVRAFWNPGARLIFLGPLLMALGGLVSLSDRRLRLAVGSKARRRADAPALVPAE